MRNFFFIVFAVLMAHSGIGQAPSFDLQACIDYALDHQADLQNALLDEQIAAARVKETVGIGLPQITGGIALQHNQRLPRFFGTYNDSPDGFSFFPTGIPNAQNGDVLAAQNFFQLKSAGDASLAINQIIFNGSYIVGLQASNAYKELSVKTKEQTQEQVILNVSKAYYNYLINKERIKLFDANIERLDSVYKSTQAMYQNGFSEKIDVDRLKVTLNNLKTEKINFEQLDRLSLQLLKFQMNFPIKEDLTIQGSITQELIDQLLVERASTWDYSARPDYQVLETNYKLQKLNIKNEYAGAIPSLVAFANLGLSTQSPTIGGIFITESSVEKTSQIGPDQWYGYSNFGLSLSWNLFTGLSRNYKIQQEKLTLQKIENGFAALKNAIDLETIQASVQLTNAKNNLISQKENMILAEDIVNVTRKKFEAGVGSNIEMVEAENSLKESQNNYYEALFNAILAKIDLQKAYGQLTKN